MEWLNVSVSGTLAFSMFLYLYKCWAKFYGHLVTIPLFFVYSIWLRCTAEVESRADQLKVSKCK